MNRMEQIAYLNRRLLEEMPEYRDQAARFSREERDLRRLLRSLMNLRPPLPLDAEFIAVQDGLLTAEREERGVVDAGALPPAGGDPRLALWQGDIVRLRADAIVNAANSALLGCFHPCHGCIDNAIHTYAGVQLRLECAQLMARQGHPEPTGQAKVTQAYNLPCQYVLHTVGPIITGRVTSRDEALLAACYRACLEAAQERGIPSVAFCCISTGEFHFPNRRAAEIALETVRGFQKETSSQIEVIFNVYKDADLQIYRELLGTA